MERKKYILISMFGKNEKWEERKGNEKSEEGQQKIKKNKRVFGRREKWRERKNRWKKKLRSRHLGHLDHCGQFDSFEIWMVWNEYLD